MLPVTSIFYHSAVLNVEHIVIKVTYIHYVHFIQVTNQSQSTQTNMKQQIDICDGTEG